MSLWPQPCPRGVSVAEVMRYFCNFDREGTGAISVLKCLEIARCLKMDQLHMLDALKDMDYTTESDSLVDFDTFEQCVMSCRERTNRQLRQREIEILVEMRVRADLFQECRDTWAAVKGSKRSYQDECA